MPLELHAEVDSLDTVEEPLRPFYRQDAGTKKFKLIDPTSIGKLESTVQNVKTERDRLKDEAAAAAAWKKLGKSPEEIQQLLDAQAAAERAKLEEAGEFEKLKKQIEDNHRTALDTEKGHTTRYRGALETHLIDGEATRAVAAAKGVPELLLPAMRPFLKFNEDGDKFGVVVVDKDGSPRLNGSNQPMTVAELVAEMRDNEIYGRAFDGSGHSGGGGGGGGGGGIPGNLKKSAMTPKEKAAFMREHGTAAYSKLPA